MSIVQVSFGNPEHRILLKLPNFVLGLMGLKLWDAEKDRPREKFRERDRDHDREAREAREKERDRERREREREREEETKLRERERLEKQAQREHEKELESIKEQVSTSTIFHLIYVDLNRIETLAYMWITRDTTRDTKWHRMKY